MSLEYAGLLYWDRTLALRDGSVKPIGVDLTYRVFEDPGELFVRQCQDAEFETSELSLSSYLAMISRGDDRFVGIPVFPSRHFRHAQIYVNVDAGIERPADLIGRRVGVLEYQMTAAVWIRAFLEHDFGVAPSDVDWVTGGLRTPDDFAERLAINLPDDVSLRRIPPETTLESSLENGQISALISAYPPLTMGTEGSRVAPLFADHRAVERDYYARTGIFPIMHLVAIRRDVYEADRSIAMRLYSAFKEAQGVGRQRLHQVAGLAVSLPWLEAELQDTRNLFGDDPFPYGVSANKDVVDALLRYALEQGITVRELEIGDLFAPETLNT